MSAKAPTHCERVLRLLSDCKPHTSSELYDLRVIAHSRVSDLRKRGHRIVQWKANGQHFYQLAPPEEFVN